MTRQSQNILQQRQDKSFPHPIGCGNDGILFGQAFLRFLCLFFVLSFSLAVAAQEEKSLVLTNHSAQPIWIDSVRYGDEKFPAGYLPPKGRIYLRLGTARLRNLSLRWHKIKTSTQQQTINLETALTQQQKKARYFSFAFEGKAFIPLQGE